MNNQVHSDWQFQSSMDQKKKLPAISVNRNVAAIKSSAPAAHPRPKGAPEGNSGWKNSPR